MTDLEDFERGLQKYLHQHQNPQPKLKAQKISHPGNGVTVSLAVRKSGQITDTLFIHATHTVSKLQARIEAEQAARAAGWTKIAYVVAYT